MDANVSEITDLIAENEDKLGKFEGTWSDLVKVFG